MSHTPSFGTNRLAASELMNKPGCPTNTGPAPFEAPAVNNSRSNIPLALRRAITFKPREDTRLRLSEGRLWITFEAPPSGPAPRNGDHFVSAGECFDLLAGESAVLEAIGPEPVACFDLEPALTLPWRAVSQQVLATLRRFAASAFANPANRVRVPTAR
ncbi:MAG: DUF2917 domain-containing protein [Burkholderiales bacterium]